MAKKIVKITLNNLSDKVDKLASAMENGFKRLDSKMDEGYKRLDSKMDEGYKRLDSKMDEGYKRLDSKMDMGFKRLDGKVDAGFKQAEENRESLARMIAGGFEDVMEKMATKDDIAKLEVGQENIQLRLDGMAPHFEVVALERRVKRLEDRTGIRHTIHP